MPGRMFPLFHHSYVHHSYDASASPTSSSETLSIVSETKRQSSRLVLNKLSATTITAATLNMTIESPPLVSYGQPKDSTGALLSGLLHLDVHEPSLRIKSLLLILAAEIETRKPVAPHCSECSTQPEVLHKWPIISKTRLLSHGAHSYPFSYHVPGHLPATNTNALGRIRYVLKASALSTDGQEIKFQRELIISRAILPGPDRHLIRVFPPTNLTANVELPDVVHPAGDFLLTVRLDGVTCPEKDTRWRLRKANWRIDEHSQVISPACAQHSSRLGGDGKGVLHEDVRVLGNGEIKKWKSNYNKTSGQIEIETMVGLPAHVDVAHNVESECGIKVTHNLVVELIVAEEHCSSNSSKSATPTGAARILRMQFHLNVTARSGLGISWDEEQPPLYENVPPPPPKYGPNTYSNNFSTLHISDLPPVYCEGVPPPS